MEIQTKKQKKEEIQRQYNRDLIKAYDLMVNSNGNYVEANYAYNAASLTRFEALNSLDGTP